MAARSEDGVEHTAQAGQHLRMARERAGLSLREVARRIDISASALSQIETGKSHPSVRTLYALTSELGLTMDEVVADVSTALVGQTTLPQNHGGAGASGPGRDQAPPPIVQRLDARPSLQLDTGVTWQRLTAADDANVDFRQITYPPGSSSSGSDKLVRHRGHEYGVVLSGELELTVGFETHTLGPGDACSFDSNEPHRLANPGTEPTTAIWFLVGRRRETSR